MKPLKERLEEREKTYREYIRSERCLEVAETTLRMILEELGAKVSLSDYATYALSNSNRIIYWVDSIEHFVDVILPEVTKRLGVKWNFKIDSSSIDHKATFKILGFESHPVTVKFYSKETDHCKIVKKSTGRKVQNIQYVEEDEFEYGVDCDDRELKMGESDEKTD